MLKETNLEARVWLDGEWVFKEQPTYRTENEYYALKTLAPMGFVPAVHRETADLLRIKYIRGTPIKDSEKVRAQAPVILDRLLLEEVRHGDLTAVHVLVRRDRIFIIDWAESRYLHDPRPDKRPEGDAYWLNRSLEELCG